MTLLADMQQAGIETGHWCPDLYVKDCPEARAILANHGMKVDGWIVQSFINPLDGKRWLDIPFNFPR